MRVLGRGFHAPAGAAIQHHGHRARLAARVDVGPVLDQHRDDVGMLSRGGPHERGLPARRLVGIDLRTVGEQQPHRINAAVARRFHQRRHARRGGGVSVGALFQQQPKRGDVAVGGRQMQRSGAKVVCRLCRRTGCEEQSYQIDRVAMRGPVQRRGAITLRLVNVGTGLQQRADRLHVAMSHRIHERRRRH